MSKGAKHEISFHFRLYTHTDNMLLTMAQTKKIAERGEDILGEIWI